MVLRVNGVNFNGLTPKYFVNNNIPTNSLQKDSFVKQKNPSFGTNIEQILPCGRIFNSCNEFLKIIENNPLSSKDLAQKANVFFNHYLAKLLGKNTYLTQDADITLANKLLANDPLLSKLKANLPSPPQDASFTTQDSELMQVFRHEIRNKLTGLAAFVSDPEQIQYYAEAEMGYELSEKQLIRFHKEKIKETLKEIKDTIKNWKVLENWSNTSHMTIPVRTFLSVFINTLIKAMVNPKIIFEGIDLASIPLESGVSECLAQNNKPITIEGLKEIRGPFFNLDGPRVKNPFRLYNILSQPILNAMKYGEGKTFIVEFGREGRGKNTKYYASIINPETKPIPDEEIDKILEGVGHRSKTTKDEIHGTGFGFSEVIKIMRENGFEKDIPNLIERNREKGVCVRIPLVGVSNPLELF